MKQSDIKKLLAKERKSHIDELTRALESGDTNSAKDRLAWIDALDKLNAIQSTERRWKWTIMIGLCCMGIVAIGLTLRSCSSPVVIDVWAPSLEFRTQKSSPILLGLCADSLRVGEATRISSITLGLSSDARQAFALATGRGGIQIDSLFVDGPAKVQLFCDSTRLLISVWSNEVRGRVSFARGRLDQGHDTREIRPLPGCEPYDLAFGSSSFETFPVEIELLGAQNWRISDIDPFAVNFVAEKPEGSGHFISTVDSGKVIMADVGEPTPLRSGDSVGFDLTKVTDASFLGRAGRIHSLLEAKVGAATRTTRTTKTNLMPRLIDTVVHNDMLKLLWGALVFLWGIGYGMWRFWQ